MPPPTPPPPRRAPSLFLSHGAGPFPAFAPDHAAFRALLRRHTALVSGCRAILLATAHWETAAADGPALSASDAPGLFFDYEHMRASLPAAAFEIAYAGRGDAALAGRVAGRLRAAGWEGVRLVERGWDHGVFVPMASLVPGGEVPVVQMSVLGGGGEAEVARRNVALGRALEGLRDEGVAVVGSGGSSHDFERIAKAYSGEREVSSEVRGELLRFEDWLRDVAEVADGEERGRLLGGWREAPASELAHPVGQAEHLMPFMIASGAGGNDRGRRLDLWDLKGIPVGLYVWEAA